MSWNVEGCLVSLVDFIPYIKRCMQEVQGNQSTFINCCWSGCRTVAVGAGGRSVLSIVLGDELMHAMQWIRPHPHSDKKKRKRETTITEASPHSRGPALRTWKERRAWKEMRYVWSGWRAVCGGAEWVEDCAWRSMKVLSFNMSHMWEGPTGLWKSAKSPYKVAARVKKPHFPFYYPLARHLRKNCSPTRTEWKQGHAINDSWRAGILAVLITDGWSNFSSASEDRFLLKRAMAAGLEELRRCLANPVECLHRTEELADCHGIARPVEKGELAANCMHMALEERH